MTESKAVAVQEDVSLRVIALAPEQMAEARSKILDWCHTKIKALVIDRDDAQENYDHALKNRWRSGNFKNQINKFGKLIVYYTKIKAAVDEGYLIVPSFPLDVFAIRTKRLTPTGDSSYQNGNSLVQSAQVLPVGEGENLSPQAQLDTYEEEYTKANNEKGLRTRYRAEEFMEVEFPAVLVKPEIIARTANALQKRIFDEVGLVSNNSKADPIVIGRIRHPLYRWKSVNFFIAWWLNYEDL